MSLHKWGEDVAAVAVRFRLEQMPVGTPEFFYGTPVFRAGRDGWQVLAGAAEADLAAAQVPLGLEAAVTRLVDLRAGNPLRELAADEGLALAAGARFARTTGCAEV